MSFNLNIDPFKNLEFSCKFDEGCIDDESIHEPITTTGSVMVLEACKESNIEGENLGDGNKNQTTECNRIKMIEHPEINISECTEHNIESEKLGDCDKNETTECNRVKIIEYPEINISERIEHIDMEKIDGDENQTPECDQLKMIKYPEISKRIEHNIETEKLDGDTNQTTSECSQVKMIEYPEINIAECIERNIEMEKFDGDKSQTTECNRVKMIEYPEINISERIEHIDMEKIDGDENQTPECDQLKMIEYPEMNISKCIKHNIETEKLRDVDKYHTTGYGQDKIIKYQEINTTECKESYIGEEKLGEELTNKTSGGDQEKIIEYPEINILDRMVSSTEEHKLGNADKIEITGCDEDTMIEYPEINIPEYKEPYTGDIIIEDCDKNQTLGCDQNKMIEYQEINTPECTELNIAGGKFPDGVKNLVSGCDKILEYPEINIAECKPYIELIKLEDIDKNQTVGSDIVKKRKTIFKDLLKSRKLTVPEDSVRIAIAKGKREKRDVLSYPTDVDSDVEMPKVTSLWENAELDSSDAESIDFEQNDPLHHVSVFTEEESVLVIRNKLVRLQNLYIKEYRKIISGMKEKQRDYMTLMKKEKEVYGPLLKPVNLISKEQLKYDKLNALSRYQKLGICPETLLFKKMIERKKAATSSIHSRSRIFNKCIYTEGGMRCSTKSVPGSKYCMKHILKDTHQVLFQPCGATRGDSICEEPVDTIFENATCPLHKKLPPSYKEIDDKNTMI